MTQDLVIIDPFFQRINPNKNSVRFLFLRKFNHISAIKSTNFNLWEFIGKKSKINVRWGVMFSSLEKCQGNAIKAERTSDTSDS